MNQNTQPDLLLKGGTLVDPVGKTTTRADVYIENGRIAGVGEDLSASDALVMDCTDRFVSPGWMDMHVHLREPGFEYKETIATGCAAAAYGGFTAVACMPNTDPPIHTRDVVEFIIERAGKLPVDVYPIACVSKHRKGKELSEMADLQAGGAVAFSDDGSPVFDAGLMRRALEYASMLNAPIINHMEDLELNRGGQMHEGAVSTRLGLPGIPGLSEDVMVARDILLSEFTGARLHVAHISTERSVDLVRSAKSRGIPVTAEVCTHHFSLTDGAVEASDYSTDTKMHPPLRSPSDVEAIKRGLVDGTIDAICTDHAPHASFEKEVEYIAAPFGIIGLETAWGLICREIVAAGVLELADAVSRITSAPRRILGLPDVKIAVGDLANLTVFDVATEWTFDRSCIRSKSHNSPFLGQVLKGRAWATYNKGILTTVIA